MCTIGRIEFEKDDIVNKSIVVVVVILVMGVASFHVFKDRIWLLMCSFATDSYILDSIYGSGVDRYYDGEYESAILSFSCVIEGNPSHDDAYFGRALSYSELGRRSSALRDYTKAIETNPTEPKYYWNRAIIYKSMDKFTKARSDFRSAANYYRHNGDKSMADEAEASAAMLSNKK